NQVAHESDSMPRHEPKDADGHASDEQQLEQRGSVAVQESRTSCPVYMPSHSGGVARANANFPVATPALGGACRITNVNVESRPQSPVRSCCQTHCLEADTAARHGGTICRRMFRP